MRVLFFLLACGVMGCGVTVDPLMPRNCRGVRAAVPDAGNGVHVVDEDGPGGSPAHAVECEFSADGAWTVVKKDTFEAPPVGYSNPIVTTCGGFGWILGGNQTFGNQTITLALPVAERHTELRLRFDLIIIDSWDGELVTVDVDGVSVFSRRCSWGNATTCNQVQDECGWTGTGQVDGRVLVDVTLPHVAPTVTVRFGAMLDQVDEWWGIDNLVLSVR